MSRDFYYRSWYISAIGEALPVRALDADDESPEQFERDALACDLCYVNITHTTALHAVKVAGETALEGR